jgi:hypothetical protein
MRLPPLAGLEDLADWVSEDLNVGDAEGRRANRCIAYASTLVRAETGSDWVDSDGQLLTRIPDAVIEVTVAAAGRAFLNPEGLTGENIDDHQQYRKVDEAGIYLTATEKAMLAAAVSGNTRRTVGLSTLGTYRGDLPRRSPVPWVNGPRCGGHVGADRYLHTGEPVP